MLKELLGELYTSEIEAKLNGKELVLKSDQENMIPKYRFDEVNTSKKELELKVEDLLKDVSKYSDVETTIGGLKEKISTITTEYESFVEKTNKEKEDGKKLSALKKYLGNENVLDPELLIPFYNLDELKFDGEELVGVKTITEGLKSKFKSQFGEVVTETPDIVHKFKDKKFGDLSLSERTKFKQEDPKGYEVSRKNYYNK